MFSDVLKRLRKREGWSQEELGRRLGLAKSTISMYENGTREPSLEILEAIADLFNVDMNTLTDSRTSTALSAEMMEYLEELRTRPEMRMLFKTAKGTKKEDIEKTVAIIEALRGRGKNDE